MLEAAGAHDEEGDDQQRQTPTAVIAEALSKPSEERMCPRRSTRRFVCARCVLGLAENSPVAAEGSSEVLSPSH